MMNILTVQKNIIVMVLLLSISPKHLGPFLYETLLLTET